MKYLELRQKISAPVFSRQDLRLRGARLFGYQLSLWQRRGHLVKLKNGLYAFSDRLAELPPEEVTGLLYSPCYLSLEKALSYYGLIPELVYAVTLVTPKTTRRFKNRLGLFTYRHLQPSLFFGYRQARGKYFPYLIAEPEKCLLDYIYFNRSRLKDRADATELRLKPAILRRRLSRKKIKSYLSRYKDPAVKRIAAMLLGKI